MRRRTVAEQTRLRLVTMAEEVTGDARDRMTERARRAERFQRDNLARLRRAGFQTRDE